MTSSYPTPAQVTAIRDHIMTLSSPMAKWRLFSVISLDSMLIRNNVENYCIRASWYMIKDAKTPEELDMAISLCVICISQKRYVGWGELTPSYL